MGVRTIAQPLRGAVFLDRDGVLNRALVRHSKPYPPRTIDEFEVIPGTAETLVALTAAGFLLLVVTNQPDVARGTQRRSSVEAMHSKLSRALPLDGIYVCYHDDIDGCDCRKPKPGLLLTAAQEHHVSLRRSYMIGDRWRDVEAGQRAGCRTVWIECGYNERGPSTPADATAGSLAEAAAWVIQTDRKDQGTDETSL